MVVTDGKQLTFELFCPYDLVLFGAFRATSLVARVVQDYFGSAIAAVEYSASFIDCAAGLHILQGIEMFCFQEEEIMSANL